MHAGPSILKCGATLEDKSSFTVKFYSNKKPEISDVINSKPTLTTRPNCQSESRGGRRAEYTLTYDNTDCQGPVHVFEDKLMGYGMTGGDGPEPPDIAIAFVPTEVKIMIEQVHYPGTPGGSTNHSFLNRQSHIPSQPGKDDPPEPKTDTNVGNEIKFIANRQHQEFSPAGYDVKHSFKLIIDPI